jgi:hypothetical protein
LRRRQPPCSPSPHSAQTSALPRHPPHRRASHLHLDHDIKRGDCTLFHNATWVINSDGTANFDGIVTSGSNNDAWLMWVDLKDSNHAVLGRLATSIRLQVFNPKAAVRSKRRAVVEIGGPGGIDHSGSRRIQRSHPNTENRCRTPRFLRGSGTDSSTSSRPCLCSSPTAPTASRWRESMAIGDDDTAGTVRL